jgi:D-alanyl-D-alanine carboxypeptidase/D-alanyl-D-alanine-endopeptidase (penicillin-binding protein 4)
MVAALRALGPRAGLGGLMKEVKFKGAKGIDQTLLPRRVVGKTGTLNFVSALVGYLTTGFRRGAGLCHLFRRRRPP